MKSIESLIYYALKIDGCFEVGEGRQIWKREKVLEIIQENKSHYFNDLCFSGNDENEKEIHKSRTYYYIEELDSEDLINLVTGYNTLERAIKENFVYLPHKRRVYIN